MRKFSEIEKKVISDLVHGALRDRTYLAINAYGDIFQREGLEFVKPNDELIFHSPQGNIPSHDKIFTVTGEIYEVSYLIDYLEKEGLIRHFSVGTGTPEDKYPINLRDTGLVSISVQIDPLVAQILYDNINFPIYVTQTLVSLVKDNFRTLEELTFDEAQLQTKEAQKQSRLSFIAVLLALLTLLLSLLQGCKGCTNSSVHNEDTSCEIVLPVTSNFNFLRNSIEGKLDAVMNNTADIRLMLQDTISIKVASCPCKGARIPPRPLDNCIKTIRINTCEDTVVSKNGVK